MEVVLDFDLESSEEEKSRWIKAIQEGKKIKTEMTYFGDGDFNGLFLGDDSVCAVCFNTNGLVDLATEMGMEMKFEDISEEEKKEIMDDLEKNGPDDSYNEFLKDSEKDFI